jgi:D-tyrosyl-tRNA(Tyr) deacylase
MKAVVQRVSAASVSVGGQRVSGIGKGLLVLVGVAGDDTDKDVELLADKVVNLRIFEDQGGKMNLSLLDVGGEALIVSQFTLLADTSAGRRPSFFEAMPPDQAEAMVAAFVRRVGERGVPVGQGVFGAMMDVTLINQGPVTIILDSRTRRKS